MDKNNGQRGFEKNSRAIYIFYLLSNYSLHLQLKWIVIDATNLLWTRFIILIQIYLYFFSCYYDSVIHLWIEHRYKYLLDTIWMFLILRKVLDIFQNYPEEFLPSRKENKVAWHKIWRMSTIECFDEIHSRISHKIEYTLTHNIYYIVGFMSSVISWNIPCIKYTISRNFSIGNVSIENWFEPN